MAIPQPLDPADAHLHILEARCPVCDQPIPNERANQVHSRYTAAIEQARTEGLKVGREAAEQQINTLTKRGRSTKD